MKAFCLTIPFILVASLQNMGHSMPETKPNAATAAQAEEPKTISDMVGEIRNLMKEVKLQFHSGTTDEDIIYGLQHTVADQRQPDSEKGKPFPITAEYFPKIVNYYRVAVAAIKDNKSDVDILPLFVDALQDMSISGEESSRIAKSLRSIQQSNNLDSRGVFKPENRDNHPTEVNQDPRLLAKNKDGMNEGIVFKMDGKEKIFMKQYLASLLEPILETTAVGQNRDSNKILPQNQASTQTATIVKNN